MENTWLFLVAWRTQTANYGGFGALFFCNRLLASGSMPTRGYSLSLALCTIRLPAGRGDGKMWLRGAKRFGGFLNSLLSSGSSTPGYASTCETLVTKLHEERLSRANKRVHASLVSGKGMKRALQAHASITDPPVALIDSNGKMSASPQESCNILHDSMIP